MKKVQPLGDPESGYLKLSNHFCREVVPSLANTPTALAVLMFFMDQTRGRQVDEVEFSDSEIMALLKIKSRATIRKAVSVLETKQYLIPKDRTVTHKTLYRVNTELEIEIKEQPRQRTTRSNNVPVAPETSTQNDLVLGKKMTEFQTQTSTQNDLASLCNKDMGLKTGKDSARDSTPIYSHENGSTTPSGEYEKIVNAYPADKRDLHDALVVYANLEPQPLAAEVVPGIEAFKLSPEWIEQNGRFIPLLSKFLKNRRYLHPPIKTTPLLTPKTERILRSAANAANNTLNREERHEP